MTLKEARKAAGMTQKELGEASGVHPVNIARIEGGTLDIGNVTARNFLNICEALEIDPYDLLPDEINDRRGGDYKKK